MKRKLIKQGGGGLTFYVPKKWTESNELRAGDEIDITDVEDNLIISRGVKIKKKSSKIIVKKDSEQLIRIRLNALYRMGFDKITVLFKTKKQAKIVKEVIEKKFIGFEVVEEKGDLLVAENVTEPSGEKQKALLRRMFFIVDESFKLLEEDLKNGTTGNKENIIQLNLRINKYSNFCRRNISKKRFTEKKINYYWELYYKILLTQHSVQHLYEMLGNKKIIISNKTKNLVKELIQHYKDIQSSFYKEDLDNLLEANDNLKNLLYNKVLKEIRKSSKEESVILYYLGDMSRLSYLTTIPLIAILLE